MLLVKPGGACDQVLCDDRHSVNVVYICRLSIWLSALVIVFIYLKRSSYEKQKNNIF